MRQTIWGVALSIVFLGALFAAAHYWPANLSQPPKRAQTAQPIRPGFAVVQRSGAWTLECFKRRKLPTWAIRMTMAAAKRHGGARPPGSTPLCHVIARIVKSGATDRWMEMIFNLTPKESSLTAFMRLAPSLAAPGDDLVLHLTNGDRRVHVLLCGPKACGAVPVVRPRDLAKMKKPRADEIAASRTAVLAFPAAPGEKPLVFHIPLEGLPRAIAALRRIGGE